MSIMSRICLYLVENEALNDDMIEMKVIFKNEVEHDSDSCRSDFLACTSTSFRGLFPHINVNLSLSTLLWSFRGISVAINVIGLVRGELSRVNISYEVQFRGVLK